MVYPPCDRGVEWYRQTKSVIYLPAPLRQLWTLTISEMLNYVTQWAFYINHYCKKGSERVPNYPYMTPCVLVDKSRRTGVGAQLCNVYVWKNYYYVNWKPKFIENALKNYCNDNRNWNKSIGNSRIISRLCWRGSVTKKQRRLAEEPGINSQNSWEKLRRTKIDLEHPGNVYKC